MPEHQVHCRNFNVYATHLEQKAVLLGNTIEAPCVIRRAIRQVTNLAHPLSPPGSGIEKRNHPKRPVQRDAQACAKTLGRAHLWGPWIIGVQQIVDPIEQRTLDPIGYTPVDEESAFILQGSR